MRYPRQILVALATATCAVALSPLQAQRRARTDARREIDAANTRFIDAYNAGDVRTFARVYAPDATLLPPNSAPIRGQSAIEQFWQGGWKAGIRNVKLTTTELEVQGNTAVEVGESQFDVRPANGPAMHERGKYIVLWKRNKNGEWQWYRDIFNSNLAPPSAASASGEPAAISAISQVMQRFTEGWSRDDSTQVWNLLADSVALYGGRRPLVGTEAVRGWARRQMATEGAMRLTPLYEQARGDQGYQVGRWEFVDPKGGVPLQSGVHTFVLRRQPDGSWKIHTMFIVDDPSAPRAPTEQARIP